MSAISTTLAEPTSIVIDMRKGYITENIFSEEPPRYNSLYLEPVNHSISPSTVCHPQLESKYNINSTSAFIDSQPAIAQSIDQIESYRCWSIFNILCCCLCLGCVACYYSSEADDLKTIGNIQGALNASRKARKINIIATIIGIIFIFMSIVRMIVMLYDKSLI